MVEMVEAYMIQIEIWLHLELVFHEVMVETVEMEHR